MGFVKQLLILGGALVKVDDQDYALVVGKVWRLFVGLSGIGYAVTSIRGRETYMHRLIMGEPRAVVDHRNRNGLDNQRRNLRVGTQSQNCANSRLSKNNTSGFKGVDFRDRRWRARIKVDRQEIGLGRYDSAEEAATAYGLGAVLYFGEYARQI